MERQFVDLSSKAKELGMSEPNFRAHVLTKQVDCYVYLRDRAKGTQEHPLPPWTFDQYPNVRWRDMGTPYDPSDTYEHGTRQFRSAKTRQLPEPEYEVTGWVRLAPDLVAELYTQKKAVSLEGWSVALDPEADDAFHVLRVCGTTEFVYGEGFTTTCQNIEPVDVMFGLDQQDETRAMDTRKERSLLRIIRALDLMAKLPDRGAATSIEKQLQELGFKGPNDETIRKVIDEARALKADKP